MSNKQTPYVLSDKDVIVDTHTAVDDSQSFAKNVTTSVRVTHRLTGLRVTCSSEISVQRNKETAMQELASKLSQLHHESDSVPAQSKRVRVLAYRVCGWHNSLHHTEAHAKRHVKQMYAGDEAVVIQQLMDVAEHEFIMDRLRGQYDSLREERHAALAQVEVERPTYECTMGVGGGDGNLFVHGDHASIKAAQKIVMERDAALAEVAGLRSLLNSLLCYVERDIDRMRSDRDKSDNKEIYDRSISLAMERLKAAQNAVFTTEPGCDTAVELAAQTTQAQHSVPEEFIGRLSEFLAQRGATGKALLRELRDMLAAAPDKEVPQAWLDVQAERRRQVEAEGWTPEHDDLYCAAELPRAAAAYILNGANDEAPAIWPFSAKWWKPSTARRDMVKACALALAEIERLDRAAPGKEVGYE
ncbi:hypothetical protein Knedl_CDS0064 [Pseudomonas phage Knedl]|nr:hypothetical protein Knedl_CDS0064 [Pseudomonas phage Knedl]